MLLLCLTLALYNPGLALAMPMAYSIDSKHGGPVSCDDDIHGWHLIWNDEFDGTQLDTSSTWAYELYDSWQYGFGQWGNDEKQFYTQENVRVEDGVLRILAMYEPNSTRLLDLCWQECFERCIKAGKVEGTADFQGCMDGCGNTGGRCANVQSTGISSGRIYAKYRGFQPSFIHPVIRIEAKIRMSHAGLGLWPAFWLLPWHDQVGSVGPGEGRYGRWPASGEIDVFESANNVSTTTTVEKQHIEMRDTHAIHGSMGDADHHHHQYSYHNVGRRPDNQCISFPQLWSVMQD